MNMEADINYLAQLILVTVAKFLAVSVGCSNTDASKLINDQAISEIDSD